MKAFSVFFAFAFLFLLTVASAQLQAAPRSTAARMRVDGRCTGKTLRRTATVSPGLQSVGKCEDKAASCKKPVKFIGESRTGCACFACDYGKKTMKILCTKHETEKTAFKRLLPKTKSS